MKVFVNKMTHKMLIMLYLVSTRSFTVFMGSPFEFSLEVCMLHAEILLGGLMDISVLLVFFKVNRNYTDCEIV